MDKLQIPLNKSYKYVAKLLDIKVLIIGIVIGVLTSIFLQILLLPMKTDFVGSYQNDTWLNLKYNNVQIGNNVSTGGFIFWNLLAFLIVIVSSWWFLRNKLWQIPQYDSHTIYSKIDSEKLRDIAYNLKEELEKIIETLSLKNEYSVHIKKDESNGFFVFLDDIDEDYLKFNIKPDFTSVKWKIEKDIVNIIEEFNKNIDKFLK